MAAVSNLAIDQGTTFSVTITVTDDTGSARNLTNYTARSQMRKSYYTTANTAFSANILSPTDGTITLDLTVPNTMPTAINSSDCQTALSVLAFCTTCTD